MISNRLTLVPASGRKSWLDGDKVKCKAVSEDHLGAYSLFEMTVAPQGGPPAHVHHWEGETYYILEGELRIQEGDRTFIASTGSVVNIPKGIRHTFKNVGTQTARLLVIITPAWDGKFFEEWASQQTNPCRLILLR